MPFVDEMRTFSQILWIGLLFAGGCAAPERVTGPDLMKGDPSAPSQLTPSEALAIAHTYAEHAWTPFARNILHGPDAAGVNVDTPDVGYRPSSGRDGWWVPGEVNNGIPYKWGGFDDPASFDRGIAAGLAAGDVSSPEKRMADNAAVSSQATGVDCSGFVSRCLKLPTVHDSSQLPAVCDPLPDIASTRPGDLLNIPRRHVMLVAGWSADRKMIYYYETGGIPEWKAALKQSPVEAIAALGYQPLRYRGMSREAGAPDKEVITRAIRSTAISVPNPIVGAP